MSARSDRAAELVAHGVIRAERACVGKVAHVTVNDARHAAKQMAAKFERIIDTYKCPFCHHWHCAKRAHGDEDDE